MTGASLFNWSNDRHTLQGGIDLFGDAFGKTNTDLSPSTDNSSSDNSTNNNSDNNNEHSDGSGDKPQLFKEYLSTFVFPNNWRTVLRINQRRPEFVTHDYVDGLFSGVFGKKPGQIQASASSTSPSKPKQEKSNWFCNVL